jgi:hypothetical protein
MTVHDALYARFFDETHAALREQRRPFAETETRPFAEVSSGRSGRSSGPRVPR